MSTHPFVELDTNFTHAASEQRSGLGLNLTPEEYGLLTDLYQLTMTACYVGKNWSSKTLALNCLPVAYRRTLAI